MAKWHALYYSSSDSPPAVLTPAALVVSRTFFFLSPAVNLIHVSILLSDIEWEKNVKWADSTCHAIVIRCRCAGQSPTTTCRFIQWLASRGRRIFTSLAVTVAGRRLGTPITRKRQKLSIGQPLWTLVSMAIT